MIAVETTNRGRSGSGGDSSTASAPDGEWFTADEVAAHFKTDKTSILKLIAAKRLVAVNWSPKFGSKRPSWRISRQAILDYEQCNANVKPAVPSTRRGRKPKGAKDFFPDQPKPVA